MSKFLKFILISVASLLLLIAVIISGIFLFVDPNEYKDGIATAVQEATGRQLTITGEIKLSIYPWIGLSLGATQLSNAEGFGNTPFASVETVEVKVKLLPLFKQRLEMQKIRLYGLRANLAKNKAGVSNWDDLATSTATMSDKQPDTETPKSQTTPVTKEPAQAMVALGALAIDGLELENAYLEWNDQQANQHVVINKLTLRTGALALPAPVDLSLSLDIKVKNPEVDGHVDFAGQVSFDLDTQQYYANNLELTVKATGPGLPASPMEAQLLANVKTDLKQQHITLNNLKLNTLGTSMTGQVNITGLDTSPAASGKIAVASFSPITVTKKLGIDLPKTTDAAVLNKVNLNFDFNSNMDGARLNNLTVMLDDSKLTGSTSVKNFSAPAIRFDIHVDDIDIDRYLPPTTVTSTTSISVPSPGAATAAATQLPLEPLRALNIDGNFKLDKLKITGAHSTDISLRVHAKEGQITLNPIKANLYKGTYKGNIALDVRKDKPKLSFNEALSGVNVGPLLKDTMGKELVSGTANASAQLTATGFELAAIKKTLNGKAKFSFLNGAIKGVNIGQMIREANAKLNKKPKPPKTNNETDFAEMSGSATIKNGNVRNQDLVMKSPLLRIHGKGSADLPRQKIKYLANTSIVKSNEGQAGKELSELKSLTIPIKVTGTFEKPKFSLDLGPVIQAKAKKAVEKKKKQIKKDVDKKIEAEKKKLKKKLEDELKKKLGIKF